MSSYFDNKLRKEFGYECRCDVCKTQIGFSTEPQTQCDDYGFYDILFICPDCRKNPTTLMSYDNWKKLLERAHHRDSREVKEKENIKQ